jgi:phage-related protein
MGGATTPTGSSEGTLFTLVHGCPAPADRCADLPGYRVLSMSGSLRPRTPGRTRATRHDATPTVACRRDKPVGARLEAGYQLDQLQQGRLADDWKPMATVGSGVQEIRIRDASGAFRLLYVGKFPEAVDVLHCFQKKTRKTNQADLQLAEQRYRDLIQERTHEPRPSWPPRRACTSSCICVTRRNRDPARRGDPNRARRLLKARRATSSRHPSKRGIGV